LTGLDQATSAFEVIRDGFAIIPSVIPRERVAELIDAVHGIGTETGVRGKAGATYAVRRLCEIVPAARRLSTSAEIRSLIEPFLGTSARVVRSLLFDKNPAANWKVPWHQDLTIAVRERREVEGFGPWSVKAGVVHVQPPVRVLAGMLTVRLHLDDCGPENGPLRVLPGSHKLGVLDAAAIADARSRITEATCTVGAGGVVLMRPLLLHASAPATVAGHRRVIHLEFAAADLPGGLEWHNE
jgi:ectoine hydroxylase-related dioxygenase (phytanoyl-CoA dioxygenase family)